MQTLDSINTIISGLTLLLAGYALTQWKVSRKSDLADEIIEQANIMVGAIKAARFLPRAPDAEAWSADGSPEDTRKNASVVHERLVRAHDKINRCYAIGTKAERYLGCDGEDVHSELRGIFKIYDDLRRKAAFISDENSIAESDENISYTKEIFESDSIEQDKISNELNSYSDNIEKILCKYHKFI